VQASELTEDSGNGTFIPQTSVPSASLAHQGQSIIEISSDEEEDAHEASDEEIPNPIGWRQG